MKKAAIVLVLYLLVLFAAALFFSWLGIPEFKRDASTIKVLRQPIMLVTIFGGLIALRLLVTAKAFRVFLMVYISLWLLRTPVNIAIEKLSDYFVFLKTYNLVWLLSKYYDSVTRICTPLPFMIYWFILYFFEQVSGFFKKNQQVNTVANEQEGT